MIDKTLVRQLVAVVGERYALTDPVELACYAYDATHHTQHPAIVLMPANTAQVAAIMEIANRERIPVVPRGAGTSLSGGATPSAGSIVLVMTRLDRIIEIDAANLTATVEPGVVLSDFHRAVEALGLFYPPDPSSMSVATMGGNVGHGSGGPRGMKYGTTKDYVIGLEVVLADGRVLHTGGKTLKNASGYDLTHLFVSSEGTLGVITQITVRLLPLPEAKETALAIFDNFDTACDAVAAIIAAKIVPTTLEVIDNTTVRRVQAYKPVGLPADAQGVLLMEVDGFAAEVAHQVQVVADIARRCGAVDVRIARTREENDDLWAARRAAYPALASARPTNLVEDATVPRNRIPDVMRLIQDLAVKYDLEVSLLGHAGDGNTHPVLLFDWRDATAMDRAEGFCNELFRATVAMGGTLSGEHGIGLSKARFMEQQHGAEGLAAMRLIKRVFDPNNILNPGKTLPQ